MDAIFPRRFLPLALGGVALAIVLAFVFNILTEQEGDEEGGVGPFFVILALVLVSAVLVWRFVVTPRMADGQRASGTAGIAVGVLAVLTGIVFWTQLAWVFGPAAIALGTVGRERREGGQATATLVLGIVGVVAVVVAHVLDLAT